MKFLKPANFSGKRVILRVDFNVPIRDGIIQSTKRIDAAMPVVAIASAISPGSLPLTVFKIAQIRSL